MKLVIATVVEEFEHDVLELFKKAKIESFSESSIDGFKNPSSLLHTTSWFPSTEGGIKSSLFFSFTGEDKIDVLFGLIKEFNEKLVTKNPIKAIVIPIEESI